MDVHGGVDGQSVPIFLKDFVNIVDLAFVDSKLNISSCCLLAMSIMPDLHLPKQDRAEMNHISEINDVPVPTTL